MKRRSETMWRVVFCLAAVLLSACGGRRGGGGGGGDDDDDSVSNQDREALDGFLAAYPAAFCGWAVQCGLLPAAEEAVCVQDVGTEIGSMTICDAVVDFYVNNRAGLDACVTGDGGACSDVDDDFCPAMGAFDYEHACDVPECTGPSDCGDGEDCVDGTCTVVGGELTTQQAVVGAWSGAANCGGTQIQISWFLCPAGRVRGFSIVGGYDYLDCGTWSATGNELNGTVSSTAVIDGSRDSYDFVMQYDGTRLYWGSCPVPLDRLSGDAVDDGDCTGGTCSAGGTGDIDCGTDCDCGRCWYCESGTCRYGGEGPYTCYRGCGF